MKKLFLYAVILFAAVALVPEAHAAGSKTYQLEEPGMRIDLPEEYTVLTRDSNAEEAEMKERLVWMEQNGAYLYAWDQDHALRIYAASADPKMFDFQVMSVAAVKLLTPHFEEEYEKNGNSVLKTEIVSHDQALFLKAWMNGSGGKDAADIIQYHTIIAQKDIRIEMRASSGVIHPEEEDALQSIVDSIVFTADFDTIPTDKTEAFLYQDPDMGVEFTVPEN